MTVREIIRQYIVAHGFDGLFNDEKECACLREESFPCAEYWLLDCEPGYRTPCDCGEHEFHIVRDK